MKRANERILLIAFCVVLITATFVSYSNSFQNKFVWDDRNFITENSYIHNFSHCGEFFTRNVGYSGGARNYFYRPLFSLLNALNYKMGGGTPPIFHITNTFLHAMCAVFVLIFIFLVFKNIYVAFSTALLFALHPVQTQAVTYISGRADPMYLFFSLLTLILFIIYKQRKGGISIYCVSMFSFVCALLSKEAAMVVPFLILFYIYTLYEGNFGEKRNLLKGTIPYFVILGIYLLLRATVLNFSKIAHTGLVLQPVPFIDRALTACKAIFLYFRFLLFPAGFQMETHLARSKSFLEPATLAAFIGVILIIAVLLYLQKRDKPLFFGLGWFFLGLLPVLNLFPVNAAMAIHWLYLPSIGFFFAMSLILWRFLKVTLFKLGPGKEAYSFLLIILLAGLLLGTLTYRKNREWIDEETLYANVLRFSQTPRIYVNLGNIYARKGEFDKAIKYYERALKIAPKQTEVYVNLGYIYIAEKKYEKAEKVLKKAVEMSPKHPNAHFNLGVVYANQGKYSEALSEMNKTLEFNPNHVKALNIKGKIYFRLRQTDKAKEAFNRSLDLDQNQPQIKRILEKIK